MWADKNVPLQLHLSQTFFSVEKHGNRPQAGGATPFITDDGLTVNRSTSSFRKMEISRNCLKGPQVLMIDYRPDAAKHNEVRPRVKTFASLPAGMQISL
jgi:hypothetical protein